MYIVMSLLIKGVYGSISPIYKVGIIITLM